MGHHHSITRAKAGMRRFFARSSCTRSTRKRCGSRCRRRDRTRRLLRHTRPATVVRIRHHTGNHRVTVVGQVAGLRRDKAGHR